MKIDNNLEAVENQIPNCPGSIQCSDCIIVLTQWMIAKLWTYGGGLLFMPAHYSKVTDKA